MDPATIAMLVSGGMSLYDKIKGVPTPDDRDASSMQGEQYGQFMDKAFPGTTPWERLGASTGGQPAANIGADTARDVEKAKFRQERTIADNANRAHIISATSPMGAAAVDSGLMKYQGFGPFAGKFDTPTQVNRDVHGGLADWNTLKGKIGKGIMQTAGGLGKGASAALDSIKDSPSQMASMMKKEFGSVKNFILNRGRSPRRFHRVS